MTSFDIRRMRVQGRIALDNASYPPRKLMMVHSGAAIGVSLVLSVLSYLLDMGIAQTGGLGGIGTRTILETVQSMMMAANMFLLPFWSIGYLRVALHWTRQEYADVRTLLSGFRNLGPVLRLLILEGLVLGLVGIVGGYAGAAVFLLTPGAQPLYALVQELTEAGITDPYAMMENEAYVAATMAMAPYMLGAGALLMAPFAYRLRFSRFVLMDQPRMGALRSMIHSWRMTRKNCLALLKLDLHFWWYHLAGLLIAALGYGDLLLGLLGVDLGVSADVAMFVFYIAGLLCEFVLYVWKKNEVFAVYALAYDQLRMPQEVREEQNPKQMPWNY